MDKEIKPLTKRVAVGGKAVRLGKQYKRIAASFIQADQRRHYLNLMLQATVAASGPKRVTKGPEDPAKF
jgi:hypothetical protein